MMFDRRSFYIALEKDKLRQANAKLQSAIDRELIEQLKKVTAK